MSLTVYKYTVPVDDRRHAIELPNPGQITHVIASQLNELTFWALVDRDAPKNERYFTVVGTGHPIPADVAAVAGTAPVPGMPIVWHLVEVMFASDPSVKE